MLKRTLLFLSFAACAGQALHAQSLPTAKRLLDIQAGGSFVAGHSDYGGSMKGYGGYGTVDFKPHFGIVADFHQANLKSLGMYERTYEIGGRYVRHYGLLDPYAKGEYGRGIFNFPPCFGSTTGQACANLAYNLFAFGGGADFKVKRYLNVRGEFEYQMWNSGELINNGLTPYFVSIGAAYHFH